jgi:glycosyltransferase involved in cell wall biosynthesis
MTVTVAIPVRNGGARFREVLDAVLAQEVNQDVELLVCDTESRDGSAAAARERGAEVIVIAPDAYSHGGTRNLLAERASGEHIAFLTHDSRPASPRWLAELLRGFDLADDVGLCFGPYQPEPGSSQPVQRELRDWFAGFSEDDDPRLDRLAADERGAGDPWRLGPRRAFFTDANGCVAKAAWREVPFREVRYAEDQQLALDMLNAGYAKAYLPRAAVVHSHDYPPLTLLRRSFDEWRGLHEVFGLVEPFALGGFRGHVTSRVRADIVDLHARGGPLARGVAVSVAHHLSRWAGALLGGRSERLPEDLRRRLSLEGRG